MRNDWEITAKFYGNKWEITGKWKIIEKQLGNSLENSTNRFYKNSLRGNICGKADTYGATDDLGKPSISMAAILGPRDHLWQ